MSPESIKSSNKPRLGNCCSRPTRSLLHICCIYPSFAADWDDDSCSQDRSTPQRTAHNTRFCCSIAPVSQQLSCRRRSAHLQRRRLSRSRERGILPADAHAPVSPPQETRTQPGHRTSLICVVRQQQRRPARAPSAPNRQPSGTLQFTLSLSLFLPRVVSASQRHPTF